MRRAFVTIGILILIAGTVTAWAVSDYVIPHTWKYKITIEVETPEGIVSGSAVRQISARLGVRLMPEVKPVQYDIKGEAVVVDLRERGILFGLIDWTAPWEVEAAFPLRTIDYAEKLNYYSNLPNGKTAELTYNHPKMVTFTDREDPKTVALVYHQKRGGRIGEVSGVEDHFEEFFGEGVRLKGITIEMTDEPVTWGKVDQYVTEDFWSKFRAWMKSMNIRERGKFIHLFEFKEGEKK